MSTQNQLNHLPVLHFSTLPYMHGEYIGKLVRTKNHNKILGDFIQEDKTIYHLRRVGFAGICFLQQLCLHVATGQQSFIGEPITRNGNVLYIMSRQQQPGQQDILRDLLKNPPFHLMGKNRLITYTHNWNAAFDFVKIAKLIANHRPALTVIVDSTSSVTHNGARAIRTTNEFTSQLLSLCNYYAGAVLVSTPLSLPDRFSQYTDMNLPQELMACLPGFANGYFIQEAAEDHSPYQILRPGLYRSHECILTEIQFGFTKSGWYCRIEEGTEPPDSTAKQPAVRSSNIPIKETAVRLKAEGLTKKAIASQLKVSMTTLNRWLKCS